MKCPELYIVKQLNYRKPIIDDENTYKGELHMLFENQEFRECYKEDCVAWDKENQVCRKVGNN